MRPTALITTLVLSAILAAGTHAAAGSRAHVSVTDRSPFTVHGSGFRQGERVTVTLTLAGHVGRKTVTTSTGGFTVRFLRISSTACIAFQVRATGSLGDRATMVFTPECAPGPTP